MGGGKKAKAPKAPNYTAIAKTEAEQSRQTAKELTQWNRPTQVDQFGSTLSWEQDGNGNWTQRQSLNPNIQAANNTAFNNYWGATNALGSQGAFQGPSTQQAQDLFNQYAYQGDFQNTAGNIGDFSNQAGDISNFQNTAGAIGEFDRSQGDRVANDFYESIMSRNRPEQARNTSSLDVQLRQQGLQPGTEAYNRAMQNLTTSYGDVNSKAALDATGAGYSAAQGIYNTNLGGQAQRYGQLQGDYSANLAGQGQRFNQQQSVYDTNLAAQNQRYNQAADVYGINSQQNAQAAEMARALQDQQYAQATQDYNRPLERAQVLQGLYANAPGGQWEGFSGATGYNPADLTGAAQAQYQAKMGGYNAGQNKSNSLLSTAGSLGGGFLGSK